MQNVLQGCQSYRTYLKAELERRCESDPKYSLRLFAKFLEMSSTSLSDVLRGKSNLSLSRVAHIGKKLGLSDSEVARFCDMTQAEDEKSEVLRRIARQRLEARDSAYTELESAVFKVISDWHHYAILELIGLDSFVNDDRSISRRLGIPVISVRNAIDRLLRLKLIEEDAGRLRRTTFNLQTQIDRPSEAVRKHQNQLLEKALTSLKEDQVESRNFTSMILAINPRLLPEAKQRINEFIEELTGFLEQGDSREVYSFNTQLFSLERNKEVAHERGN